MMGSETAWRFVYVAALSTGLWGCFAPFDHGEADLADFRIVGVSVSSAAVAPGANVQPLPPVVVVRIVITELMERLSMVGDSACEMQSLRRSDIVTELLLGPTSTPPA